MESIKKFEEYFADYGKGTNGFGHLGYRILTCIFAGIMEMGMFFPIDIGIEKNKESMFFPLMMGVLSSVAVFCVISPYVVQREEGEGISIYKKLSYVPVEKRQIRKGLMQKLFRYIGISMGFAVVQQVGMTLIVCPQFVWQNLLYAVLVAGGLPVVVGMIQILIRT